ncbi:MAG: hypothetical protein ACREQN_12425 [Candidatus Binataceae bacterium]
MITQQSIKAAFDTGKLSNIVKDLNGDGRYELVLWRGLAGTDTWIPEAAAPRWPAIYRLVNGKYVEDSRDFLSFYDTEILPPLEKAIATANSRGYADAAAIDQLEKDKILRVLGRNPTAGLNQAYQWMNSSDPTLLQCALATFSDIGGHEQEVQQLRKSASVAYQREIDARKGG